MTRKRETSRRGVFVTGTDTGVGKTVIGTALVAWLKRQDIPVRVRKPIESGAAPGPDGTLLPADAQMLAAAAGVPDPLQRVCPFPLPTPVSPDRAARLAGVHISLADLQVACLNAIEPSHFLLVEGAGGFCSPLVRDGLNADLAERLGLPVLLVASDRLGCINHSLLTLEAIERRGLRVAALVLNRGRADRDMDNVSDLSRWSGREVIAVPESDTLQPSPDVPAAALERIARAVLQS